MSNEKRMLTVVPIIEYKKNVNCRTNNRIQKKNGTCRHHNRIKKNVNCYPNNRIKKNVNCRPNNRIKKNVNCRPNDIIKNNINCRPNNRIKNKTKIINNVEELMCPINIIISVNYLPCYSYIYTQNFTGVDGTNYKLQEN